MAQKWFLNTAAEKEFSEPESSSDSCGVSGPQDEMIIAANNSLISTLNKIFPPKAKMRSRQYFSMDRHNYPLAQKIMKSRCQEMEKNWTGGPL